MKLTRFSEIIVVNIKICLIEISTNLVRSIITSIGIILAVTSLLWNMAFIRGMDDDLRNRMARIGSLNIVTVNRIKPVTQKEKIAFQISPGLNLAEAHKAVDRFPYVNSVLTFNNIGWQRCKSQGNRTWGKLLAVNVAYCQAYNYEIGSGRMFTREDLGKRKKVCIIGERLAERLFGKGANALGKILTVNKIPLQVIGIIGAKDIRNERSRECLMPFSVYARTTANARRNLSEISLVLESTAYTKQAIRELVPFFTASHRGVKDFEIEANIDKVKEMEMASLGLKIIFWCIAIISLAVGGISIMNIMFATIGERIREIGIRKSLGANRYDIFTQFIIEAIFLCLVGCTIGLILGSLVTLLPPGLLPYDPRLTYLDYLVAILFTFIAGLFSGLFPALRAAKMQPVEALQY